MMRAGGDGSRSECRLLVRSLCLHQVESKGKIVTQQGGRSPRRRACGACRVPDVDSRRVDSTPVLASFHSLALLRARECDSAARQITTHDHTSRHSAAHDVFLVDPGPIVHRHSRLQWSRRGPPARRRTRPRTRPRRCAERCRCTRRGSSCRRGRQHGADARGTGGAAEEERSRVGEGEGQGAWTWREGKGKRGEQRCVLSSWRGNAVEEVR